MKNTSKLLCLLLALMMILPMAVSCNKTNKGDEGTSSDNTTTEGTVETVDPIYTMTDLDPRDLTDEDYVIGYSDYADSTWTPRPVNVNKLEASKDTVSAASYSRDRLFESLTNANIVYESSNTNPNDFTTGGNSEYVHIQQLEQVGDLKDYDMLMVGARTAGAMMNHKVFLDMNEYDNLIHSDAKYYNNTINQQLSIGGKQLVTAGYYTINNIKGAQCVTVNNSLLTQVHGEDKMEEMYTLALENQWTMEVLLEYDKGFASNDGDAADAKYALVISEFGSESLFFVLGGETIVKDDQDLPTIALNNSTNVNLITYIQSLTMGNDLVYVAPQSGSGAMFVRGQALFQIGMIGALGAAKQNGYDERLMPVPTYAAGDAYRTDLPSWNANVSGIPAQVEDPDMAAYCYELFMALSYQTIYPEYYQKLFALQYVENATESQIFDVIAESIYIDLATYYRWYEDYGNNVRRLVVGKDEPASGAETHADTLKVKVEEFLGNYNLG